MGQKDKSSPKRRTRKYNKSPRSPEASASENIGEQIRELRKAKRLTLQDVSARLDLSVGYLSQIERNQSKLPIGVLKKLSDVFGVHINWFFHVSAKDTSPEKNIVVRKTLRRRFSFTQLGITEELLSPNLIGPIELIWSTIAAGADSGEYNHDGDEAGVVISGVMELWVGGTKVRLEAGDSFSFKSTQTHRLRNPGKVPTQVVWVITPPCY